MMAIYKREIKAYFNSAIAYIFIGFSLLLCGFFFIVSNIANAVSDMNGFFSNLSVVYLFLLPILTMRLLSEERKTKTDQILLTSPVSIFSIVFAKFLAALTLVVISIAITLLYVIVLAIFGNPAYGTIISSYIGFILMGSAFVSIGLFISSLTENQVVASVSTFGILLLLWVIDWVTNFVNNPIFAKVISYFSILKRFEEFNNGLLSIAPILYYLSICAIFIFLTVRVIEKRRWS